MKNLTEIAMQVEPLYINWVGALLLVIMVAIALLWIRHGVLGLGVRKD